MVEKLRQLKKKSHMTNQQIAEKSNIPESTVARIFSGKTPNPTVSTVISMARAMGGSAADLLSEESGNFEEDRPANDSELMNPGSDKKGTLAENAESLSASDDKSSAFKGSECLVQDSQSLENVATHEKMYEDIINLYKNEMKKKDVWLSRLFWCLAGIMMFILFVLIFDILHPSFGFVKY